MPLKINRNPKEIPQYPLNEHTTANLDCRTGPGQELRTARGSLTALVTNDTFLGLGQVTRVWQSHASPGRIEIVGNSVPPSPPEFFEGTRKIQRWPSISKS
ncbi:unnamed protein product [Plutella xylostella]|uniref:(diamondback moth) hypothetical protein n=1 Tax=Plutella xylostella TaxID=51655 RepID=A0A8S4F7P8_PLUXY|nr:unnamed protein product [Plutella xylostella]